MRWGSTRCRPTTSWPPRIVRCSRARTARALALRQRPDHSFIEALAVAALGDLHVGRRRAHDLRVLLHSIPDEEEAAHYGRHSQVLARVAEGDALVRRVAPGAHVARDRVRL